MFSVFKLAYMNKGLGFSHTQYCKFYLNLNKGRKTSQTVDETSGENSESEAPASISDSTTSPILPEEDYDEYYESNNEFSFYKFSQLHFKGNATHTHVTQRLKQPLLLHEDEGDTLVRGQREKTVRSLN